ncbi:hypothetical protein ACUIAK_15120 [Bacillus cytotoxicus]
MNSIARGISFGLEPVSTSIIGALSSILSAGTLIIVGGFASKNSGHSGSFNWQIS